MHRTMTIIGFIVIFISGYLLFAMKREVETLSFELSEIQKQINVEKGSINLLKTEYVYLTSPARLSKLAAKYLNLKTTAPDQMVPDPVYNSVKVASENGVHNKENAIADSTTKHVKWNYKRMGSQYLHRASLRKK